MTWEELKEKAKELGFTISYYLKDYEFKKRTLNTDTELYGVKRARKISFLKGKGYSRHEAVLRSFTKTELIAICQTLYSFVDNAKVKELYKDFKYEELKQDD